jgi:hypothetical protein
MPEGTMDERAILAMVKHALDAANAWKGEGWYEPTDLRLALRFGDLEAGEPTIAGWEATLGDLTISGANTPLVALEMLRDTFANLRRSGGAR